MAVKQTEGGREFLLRATIDFMAFNSLVQNLRLGRTGYAFILNREGKYQTQPAMDIPPDPDGFEFFWSAVEKTKNKILITQWTDETGVDNLYGVGSLKNGQWLLIVKQQTADAFSIYGGCARWHSLFLFWVQGVLFLWPAIPPGAWCAASAGRTRKKKA
ncbi:MAG: hypothetical protein R2860_00745 [Desulfobacterales bacterium]